MYAYHVVEHNYRHRKLVDGKMEPVDGKMEQVDGMKVDCNLV